MRVRVVHIIALQIALYYSVEQYVRVPAKVIVDPKFGAPIHSTYLEKFTLRCSQSLSQSVSQSVT